VEEDQHDSGLRAIDKTLFDKPPVRWQAGPGSLLTRGLRPFLLPLFRTFAEEEFSEVRGSNLRCLVSNEAAIVSG
jgi:hypothetical protein